MTCRKIASPLARHPVNSEQIINAFDDFLCYRLAERQFMGFEQTSTRMRPAGHMHHLRPAHLFVADVAVGLQYSLEPFQELFRPRPSPAHLKLEHHAASGAAILPEIGLMIFAPPVVCLHIHRGFIRLNVSAP